ncbi:MAG: hypothetical protein ACYDA0_05025 [Candidatus Dormibacteraceae bacterium]
MGWPLTVGTFVLDAEREDAQRGLGLWKQPEQAADGMHAFRCWRLIALSVA